MKVFLDTVVYHPILRDRLSSQPPFAFLSLTVHYLGTKKCDLPKETLDKSIQRCCWMKVVRAPVSVYSLWYLLHVVRPDPVWEGGWRSRAAACAASCSWCCCLRCRSWRSTIALGALADLRVLFHLQPPCFFLLEQEVFPKIPAACNNCQKGRRWSQCRLLQREIGPFCCLGAFRIYYESYG